MFMYETDAKNSVTVVLCDVNLNKVQKINKLTHITK